MNRFADGSIRVDRNARLERSADDSRSRCIKVVIMTCYYNIVSVILLFTRP